MYRGLDKLPHFNPDLEPIEPSSVTDLRRHIKWSDGLLISTPEYAHGLPGTLKNALDWLVSSEEFIGKPIALFNASPRALHAQAALTEIVTTMAGRVVTEASLTVSLLGKQLDINEILTDLVISDQLSSALLIFSQAIRHLQATCDKSVSP